MITTVYENLKFNLTLSLLHVPLLFMNRYAMILIIINQQYLCFVLAPLESLGFIYNRISTFYFVSNNRQVHKSDD